MATDSTLRPKFDNPPVIETALSVQFAPISGFTSGHFGWYWKESLDSSWVKTIEAPPLPDQFEQFGDQQSRMVKSIQLIPFSQPDRLQIVNSDDDRVIQLQNTRFLYNWRKIGSKYPSFETLYPEFSNELEGFRDFLRHASLDPISPNQWEIIYVNHIPKGGLWETSEDWHRVLPGLFPEPIKSNAVRFESVTAEWHFEIVPRKGRIHISATHGRLSERGEEILVLQLTARGPIAPDDPMLGLELGLALGHDVLVQTFARVVSEAALKQWGFK